MVDRKTKNADIYRGRQHGRQQQIKLSGIQHKHMSTESEHGQISG